jgi:hypothetical protein
MGRLEPAQWPLIEAIGPEEEKPARDRRQDQQRVGDVLLGAAEHRERGQQGGQQGEGVGDEERSAQAVVPIPVPAGDQPIGMCGRRRRPVEGARKGSRLHQSFADPHTINTTIAPTAPSIARFC